MTRLPSFSLPRLPALSLIGSVPSPSQVIRVAHIDCSCTWAYQFLAGGKSEFRYCIAEDWTEGGAGDGNCGCWVEGKEKRA